MVGRNCLLGSPLHRKVSTVVHCPNHPGGGRGSGGGNTQKVLEVGIVPYLVGNSLVGWTVVRYCSVQFRRSNH